MPWLFYWLFRLHWTFHLFCSSLYLFSIRSAFLSLFHSIVFLSSQYYGTQASGPETGILLPRKLKKRSLERRKKNIEMNIKKKKGNNPKRQRQAKKKWANGAGLWTMNLKRRPQTISERKKILWGGNMKTITKARVPFQNRTQSNVYEKERERERKKQKKKVRLLQTQSNG